MRQHLLPRKRGVTLGVRAHDLSGLNLPDAQLCLKPGRLSFRFSLKPCSSPFSRTYRVHLRLNANPTAHPEVFVESPDLRQLSDGREIPHIYPSDARDGVKLCLWYPPANEWRQDMRLSETVVPWAAEWLSYFELWLATDHWSGGGMHEGKLTQWDRSENDEQ